MKYQIVKDTLLIGHRGATKEFRENTIKSFSKAIDCNIDMIETDLRRTADKVMLLFHDSRINGKYINRISYKEVLEESAKKGYVVPTLEELLELCKGNIKLNLELKEEGYEKEAVEQVLRYLDAKDIVLSSFSKTSVEEVKKNFPMLSVGLLIEGILPVIFKRAWSRSSADFMIPNHNLFSLGINRYLKKYGFHAFTWTVNNKRKMKSLLLNPRVKGIISNLPDLLLKTRQELLDDLKDSKSI